MIAQKHGKSNTRLYNIWTHMKARCYNKNDQHYENYGSRGIVVCDEWKHNFMNFYNWAMNNGYRENLSIDRIDVDGNYEPDNCRWVDVKIQNCNKRTSIYLTYDGKTQTIGTWANELNINKTTIYYRYHKLGWSDKECLFWRDNK